MKTLKGSYPINQSKQIDDLEDFAQQLEALTMPSKEVEDFTRSLKTLITGPTPVANEPWAPSEPVASKPSAPSEPVANKPRVSDLFFFSTGCNSFFLKCLNCRRGGLKCLGYPEKSNVCIKCKESRRRCIFKSQPTQPQEDVGERRTLKRKHRSPSPPPVASTSTNQPPLRSPSLTVMTIEQPEKAMDLVVQNTVLRQQLESCREDLRIVSERLRLSNERVEKEREAYRTTTNNLIQQIKDLKDGQGSKEAGH